MHLGIPHLQCVPTNCCTQRHCLNSEKKGGEWHTILPKNGYRTGISLPVIILHGLNSVGLSYVDAMIDKIDLDFLGFDKKRHYPFLPN